MKKAAPQIMFESNLRDSSLTYEDNLWLLILEKQITRMYTIPASGDD